MIEAVENEFTELEALETREWIESLDYVIEQEDPRRVEHLLRTLQNRAALSRIKVQPAVNTPFINTIPVEEQPPYPGDTEIERRIKSLVRWNAMAMVVRANKQESGIGGHISTYASAATLYEVGFNHFFRAKNEEHEADLVFFQGHASPGFYSRAFLEGRLTVEQLENFRRELKPGGGLSSYPHPWLMPTFWQFPTVSMGLGPIQAIYQARFLRYLEDRGLKKIDGQRVWAFLGDGETDEPETLGAISLATRARLDNLVFVVNCNLQRLDGPVRGNGNIIQELEAIFLGAGWNVIKVAWGSDWDPLLANDADGALVKRMGEVVDGERQKYSVETGKYFREHFFGVDPRLLELVKDIPDERLCKLRLGGHDPKKVYAAYKAAVEHCGEPTVVLARTIKGYGLGESGEGKNITHQQKKLNEDEVRQFRARFGIPIPDDEMAHLGFYKPPDSDPEMSYLHARRKELGGYLPSRSVTVPPLKAPDESLFEEFYAGTGEREASSTMVIVRMLAKMLRDKELGKLIVPIVPDEARTFGMESLFRQVGIYSRQGQLYDPVDRDTLLYYKEAKDGQILEEGITEAGSMASFIAAGTAYSVHGINTIPFFIYYSMFGQQRVGDLVWAAGDSRCRGFMVGGTAGRTTLSGEGLQHQDGNSHLLAYTVPNLIAYDPAYAYEIAVIIQDGIRRMYVDQESVFYYLTVMNENYVMPPMPEGAKEGILKGLYLFKPSELKGAKLEAQLLGSGAILNEAVKAQKTLGEKYGVAAHVWSVTSYKELYREAHATARWNMLHPAEAPRRSYVEQRLAEAPGVIVAASDYVKALPDSIARWLPQRFVSLGTDGFGRSEGRAALRDFFEVDARFITLNTLVALAREKKIKPDVVQKAMKEMGIDPEKADPVFS
ncbi:MAG: pyruvate dehydrogenase (acetyl-transferring), homodimeric type [Terriglobia bacterium]